MPRDALHPRRALALAAFPGCLLISTSYGPPSTSTVPLRHAAIRCGMTLHITDIKLIWYRIQTRCEPGDSMSIALCNEPGRAGPGEDGRTAFGNVTGNGAWPGRTGPGEDGRTAFGSVTGNGAWPGRAVGPILGYS
jgi:hypothetical protein